MTLTTYHVSGPCNIIFDGIKFGTTKAGVYVRPRVTWKPVITDGFGVAPGAFISAGKSAVVETVLTRTGLVAGFNKILLSMFPDGLYSVLTGEVTNPLKIGGLASTIAKELIIEETAEVSPNVPEQWIAPKVVLSDPADLLLAATSEQNWPLTFIIIPDPVTSLLFSQLPSYLT